MLDQGDAVTTPFPNPQSPQPATVPAGWYPDPQGAPLQRWWDGRQWTAHTAPAAPLAHATARAGSLYNGAKDAAAGKNSAGTWSLVMGILGVVFGIPRGTVLLSLAFGVAAIVWGSVGLARASRYGVKRGTAIAGLILGILTVVLTLAWVGILNS